MDPIVSIEAIDKLAKQAAMRYANVNEACPYPFGTQAAQEFCCRFTAYQKELPAYQKVLATQKAPA